MTRPSNRCFFNIRHRGFSQVWAVWITQLAMVARHSATPSRSQIFSCRYSGRPSTYLRTMMSATVEADARLCFSSRGGASTE